jgi:hypothetical protein
MADKADEAMAVMVATEAPTEEALTAAMADIAAMVTSAAAATVISAVAATVILAAMVIEMVARTVEDIHAAADQISKKTTPTVTLHFDPTPTADLLRALRHQVPPNHVLELLSSRSQLKPLMCPTLVFVLKTISNITCLMVMAMDTRVVEAFDSWSHRLRWQLS